MRRREWWLPAEDVEAVLRAAWGRLPADEALRLINRRAGSRAYFLAQRGLTYEAARVARKRRQARTSVTDGP
jgi:hypothetical protein